MSIADRAIQAHEAQVAADEAEKEAARLRRRAEAIEAFGRRAYVFGATVDPELLEEKFYGGWEVTLSVDDDTSLVFAYKPAFTKHDQPTVEVTVRPCDQLYWDLPPGEETKGPGGGTYACYGLTRERKVETLADLGAAIQRVRNARAAWRRKHCSGRA